MEALKISKKQMTLIVLGGFALILLWGMFSKAWILKLAITLVYSYVMYEPMTKLVEKYYDGY